MNDVTLSIVKANDVLNIKGSNPLTVRDFIEAVTTVVTGEYKDTCSDRMKSRLINDFLDDISYKYSRKKYETYGFTYVDRYGGEGCGDEYWMVLKWNNQYWRIPGWYNSYEGGEYRFDDVYECRPTIETKINFTKI